MGVINSLEFVPSNYKIKYVDSLVRPQMSIHNAKKNSKGKMTLKVMFAKDIVEKFK